MFEQSSSISRYLISETGSAASKPLTSREQVEENILELISASRWFSYVPLEGHRWLAQRAAIKSFARGKSIFQEGDLATHVYAVMSGSFRVFLTDLRGGETTLNEAASGDWFPHLVPIDAPRHSGNCVCHRSACVAAFSLSVIKEFSRRWPMYYQGLYHDSCNRGMAEFSRIELLSRHTIDVRLAADLLRTAKIKGRTESDGSIWFGGRDTQGEVGIRVSGARQRISSVLKSWAQNGWIEVFKDGTRIKNINALEAVALDSGFDLDRYLADAQTTRIGLTSQQEVWKKPWTVSNDRKGLTPAAIKHDRLKTPDAPVRRFP